VLLGGPGPGYAGFTVVMYLFAIGFQQGNLGYASAIGWALVIVTAMVSIPAWGNRRLLSPEFPPRRLRNL
jgi:ABC-type sugar transport system permease subunit